MEVNKINKIVLPLIFILALLIVVGLWQKGFFAAAVQQDVVSCLEQYPGKLRVDFFSVGQGDSALIRTPQGQKILVDGGPDDTAVRKLGQYLPFYDKEINLIVLTHPHSDHVAGLVEILKRYKVDKIMMTGVPHTTPDYLAFLELIKDKNIPVEAIKQKQIIDLENNLKWQILYPDRDLSQSSMDNLNNSSIVARLVYVSSSFLFMGDYEEEEGLASVNEPSLKSDVLKIGHHGSTNANSPVFLQAVAPTYSVISVGRDNQYGLPGYRTIYELKKLGSIIYRTDESGDIRLLSDGNKILATSCH